MGLSFLKPPIPPWPKRVTKKAIERLKALTIDELYKRAVLVNEQSGEAVSTTGTYADFKKSRRSAASKEAWRKRREAFEQPYDSETEDSSSDPIDSRPETNGNNTVLMNIVNELSASPRDIAQYLYDLLAQQIDIGGLEALSNRMYETRIEALHETYIVVDESRGDLVKVAAKNLAQLILGDLPPDVEKTINDLMEVTV